MEYQEVPQESTEPGNSKNIEDAVQLTGKEIVLAHSG